MQAHLKPYTPSDKQDQAVKKDHMQTLTKNSNKNTINSSFAQSRNRRHIKAPVKLDIQLRLQLACKNLCATTFKIKGLDVRFQGRFQSGTLPTLCQHFFAYMYEIDTVSIYCTVHIYTVNKSHKQGMGTSNKLRQAYFKRKCYEKKLATSFYKVKGRNNCIHVKEAPCGAIF